MTLDDPFEAIVAGLDIPEPIAVESVRDLTDPQLSERLSETRQELLDRGEMQHPRTDRGRELHSRRVHCLIEIRRRQRERREK